MAGHTPGPWATMNHYLIATVADPTVIASVRNFKDEYDYEAAANARLIAAAPELLEALKEAVRFAEPATNPSARMPNYERARAAIAKAEGTK